MEKSASGYRPGEEFLQKIVGARLTSVQFVLDYLILGFDERGALTTLVWPKLIKHNASFAYAESGYRDALCGLIYRTVRQANISAEETITIIFEDGTQIGIPLRSYESKGERAIFAAPKHVLYAW
jgi:hypothetical protein